MKKLTDEIVAKALGWKKFNSIWIFPNTVGGRTYPPSFTKDLNALMGAIYDRGLYWKLIRTGKPLYQAFIHPGEPSAKWGFCASEKTAPLALCHALLAYLKRGNPITPACSGSGRKVKG